MGVSTLNNLDRDVWRMILDHLYVPDGQTGADHAAPAAAVQQVSQPEAAPVPASDLDEKKESGPSR
jgi:hypothetical protein